MLPLHIYGIYVEGAEVGRRHYRIGWSDFLKKKWTLAMVCQIILFVLGPQFQNLTWLVYTVTCHRISERFACYPKVSKKYLVNKGILSLR